jgi:GNAT superfamily N-acetyltransferase
MTWQLRPSTSDDAAWIAELRAVVLRDDLERLGIYDPVRVRRRFLDAFDPALTQVIVVAGRDAGSIALRPDAAGALWIEHFYLDADLQGRGIGRGVLERMLSERTATFRLNVLQGSPAYRLYARLGFVVEHEDSIDLFLVRPPQTGTEPGLVRKSAVHS